MDGDTALDGYLMTPEIKRATNLPGLLVFPHFMGSGSIVERNKAREYAERGMVVFVADYYGKKYNDGKTEDVAEALTQTYPNFVKDTETAARIALLSLAQLTSQPNVDAEKIGVMGFCMGGIMSGIFARAGGKAAVCISLHGYNQLPADATAPGDNGYNIKYFASFYGRNDPTIPPAMVEGSSLFLDEVTQKYGGDYEAVIYSNTVHSFSLPSTQTFLNFLDSIGYGGAAKYNAKSSAAAFARTDEIFKLHGLLK
jgi:dienelactone hydrolase